MKRNLTLTTRDLEVIDFVTKFKVANASIIQRLFFPSRTTCQRRLKVMADSKKLKRLRSSINSEYIYFVKQPKQVNHALAVANVYADLVQKYTIKKFKIEPVLGSIRPDAIFYYLDANTPQIGMLEVELSHKKANFIKYQNFLRNGEAKANGFTKFTLFVYQNGELKAYPLQ
jgi:hypothetical protein